MITVNIPGRETLILEHLVLDFNGTLAVDGVLLPGVRERLNELSEKLEVHVLTADTFGTGRKACQEIKAKVHILEEGREGAVLKQQFIETTGANRTVAVGNGNNDTLMLKHSALGIMVLGPEGASSKAAQAADVVVTDINHGLDMLIHPKRLVATLRA